MPENLVSLIRFENDDSVARAVELCEGLAALPRGAKVLVKPNLVGWDAQGPYPPWGVLTTSRVVEALCRLLRDAGAGEIWIGEGAVACDAIGSSTQGIYERLGYRKLVERYGVELIDFNEEQFEPIELGAGHRLKVTRRIRQCDFLVSAPVLKTHGTTRVSLGIKNLKGLLHAKSKSYCHHPEGMLDKLIARLGSQFPPALTLIDGIYANEQGPLHFGRAHRFNLLIASTDVYAADLVGADLIGYGTDQVQYLRLWAEKHGRATDPAAVDLRGDLDPEAVRRPLKWDWAWNEAGTAPEAFDKAGLSGIRLPKYDATLCTGCSYMFNPLMLTLLSSKTKAFDNYEFLTGKTMAPSGQAKKTFLFGKCQSKKNKDHPDCSETVPIKGCPPALDRIERILRQHGLPVSRAAYDGYRRYIMSRYWKQPDTFPPRDFYLDDIPDEARPPIKE